jgi:hypothetical protein
MSRIRVTIDRLVLKGVDAASQKPLVEGLQTGLSQILSGQTGRAEWARSHRTPVLKLGRMSLSPGPSGGRQFGTKIARSIGRGLKP